MKDQSEITLRLQRNDVGQIVDALTTLSEEWSQTANYFATGDAECSIRECKNFEEASNMHSIYERIISELVSQIS